MASRAGSNAGRGFRYQDAVAAWFAIRASAGRLDWGLVIPEGEDDVELRGEGLGFAQIKSRRAHLGLFSAAEVAGFIRGLWDRHDAAASPPDKLILVAERGIVGVLPATEPSHPGEIDHAGPLSRLLQADARSTKLLAKTQVLVVASPQELSIEYIIAQRGCRPLAAQICFSDVLGRIGELADENGRHGPANYRGLSRSDVDAAVTDMLGALDVDALDRALVGGLCEAVDFTTPIHDPNFYLGVDVEPGHVVSGLVMERPAEREAIATALETRGNALVVGPSGAGKSALMWEAAHAVRHVVRWFRVQRLAPGDVPALRQLARTFRASRRSPVGFVFDDVGRHGFEGWSELMREAASVPGVLMLGSVREEDIFLLTERARTVEIRAEAEDELAERLWQELRASGATGWSGWREPWVQSQHLLLEYVHILTQGARMPAVLGDQVAARVRDPTRALELAVLRVSSCAAVAGALVDVERLTRALGETEDNVARALHRLIEEQLVRSMMPGLVGGLHQLRSQELLHLTHAMPPPSYARTLVLAALSAPPADLEPLVFDALSNGRADRDTILAALVGRLEADPDPKALAAALRGLGGGFIATSVECWLALPEVAAIPRTQVTTAAMFGVARTDLRGLPVLSSIAGAATRLTEIMNDSSNDPRGRLLVELPAALLGTIIARTHDLHDLERILAALIGHGLQPDVRAAIAKLRPDLLCEDLRAVAALLGTLTIIEPTLARDWVEQSGEAKLLARISHEWPWTSAPELRTSEDGQLVCCDYWYVAASRQPEPHDDVVALCELILGLCPRAEVSVSNAITINGDVAGLPGCPLAAKRIPRNNLPPASLPEWNRRWKAAIAWRVATSSYSEYLTRGTTLLNELVPLVESVFDLHLRGLDVPQNKISALNALNDQTEQLTPPRQTIREIAGIGSGEPSQHVTNFQHVIHGASLNLIRRYAVLPDEAGAYIGWLGDLIEAVDTAIAEEPWSLIETKAPELLLRLRTLFEVLRVLASEAHVRQEAPSKSWKRIARSARRGNAVRAVGTVARSSSDHRRHQIRTNLQQQLIKSEVKAKLFLRRCTDGQKSWALSEILLLVPAENILDAQLQVRALAEIRSTIDTQDRLYIVPEVDGFAIDRLAIGGFETLFPSAGNSAEWLDALSIHRLSTPATEAFGESISLASELASLDRLSLGAEDRPTEERNARAAIENDLGSSRAALSEALKHSAPDFDTETQTLVDEVRAGRVDVVRHAIAALTGAPAEELVPIGVMTTAILQAELDAAKAERQAGL